MIEDNPGDVRLTREMFDEEGLDTTVHVVDNGVDALDFLSQRGDYSDVPRPDLVLLDWHLPGKNGGDVLAQLKKSEDLKDIPVAVQSGSTAELDVLKEKNPRADGYVTKPIDTDDLSDITEGL